MKKPIDIRLQEFLLKAGPSRPDAIAEVFYKNTGKRRSGGRWICGARSVIVRAAKRHGFQYKCVGRPPFDTWLIFPKTESEAE